MSKFLEYLSRVIQRRYRTTATQSRSKPVMAPESEVNDFLLSEATSYWRGQYSDVMNAVRPLLRQFTIASLLYREYRSGAIHEFAFVPGRRFFEADELYPGTARQAWEETVYLEVRVSAPWLFDLYTNSLANYQKRLMATGKLPLSLWSRLCEMPQELDSLDEDSVDVGREMRIAIDR